MKRFGVLAVVLCLAVLCLAGGAVVATDSPTSPKKTDAKPDGQSFIRVERNKKKEPIGLDTATVRYVSADPKRPYHVDLIGCVHVADRGYYADLNRKFKEYDVVLFEMVMPEGKSMADAERQKGRHPISVVQESMPKMLDLSYQLNEINYKAKNFVHADMSPEAMSKAIQSRGDTGTSVAFKAFFDILKQSAKQANAQQEGGLAELQMLAALFDSNRPLQLKRLMAGQMEIMGPEGGLGETLDTLLVQDRNAAAMKVLRREVNSGRKKIAIFYGAAHMPDFDRRLTQELGLKRESPTWSRAWDMSGR